MFRVFRLDHLYLLWLRRESPESLPSYCFTPLNGVYRAPTSCMHVWRCCGGHTRTKSCTVDAGSSRLSSYTGCHQWRNSRHCRGWQLDWYPAMEGYISVLRLCQSHSKFVCKCIFVGVGKWAVMHRGKTLQIWGPQPVWISQQEPPRNSVLGAGLQVEISLTPAWFPKSFLQIENLGQHVSMHLCTLNYVKFH